MDTVSQEGKNEWGWVQQLASDQEGSLRVRDSLDRHLTGVIVVYTDSMTEGNIK